MKIGSLCSGYGGLDLAVEAVFEAKTVWMCDIDKYANIAIEHNWNIPNLGDLKNVNWNNVEKIDILTAGYPCQPFSQAGQRKGINDKRHIWPHIKKIIGTLQPRWVILENVRGHLSLGFKEVLKDLTEIGYDTKWAIVRASDVGAPHQRARLFIVAYPNSHAHSQSRRTTQSICKKAKKIIDGSDRKIDWCCCETLKYTDTNRVRQSLGNHECSQEKHHRQSQFEFIKLEQTCGNTDNQQLSPNGKMQELGRRFDTRFAMSMRPIPNPLDDGKLNTKFVEYMMGLPEGWITNLPISRAQQFKLLGNGVVPQQAEYAIKQLLKIDCD